jgi:DNA-directed RNA polymerase subunit RPC12/RpoP
MPYCANCGTFRNENEVSCSKCGTPAALPAIATTPVAAPPADPRQVAAASQAAMGAAAAMQYQTYAQRMCPNCSHHMIVVFRQPRLGWILLLIGLLIFWIPLFGWVFGPVLIIAGIVIWITQKGKARYQCPGCNYST